MSEVRSGNEMSDSSSFRLEHFLPDLNATRDFIAEKVSVLKDIINTFENVNGNSDLIAYCDLQLTLLEPMLNEM